MNHSTFVPVAALRGIAVASALCCAAFAQAQTADGVVLYGLADIAVTQVTGLKAGTVTQVASGVMEGSRWGIKGSEDLGGGYRALFTAEARVELDSGASSNRPISGSQLSDKFSQAGLLGLPAALQPAVAGVDAALANEFGVNVGASGGRAFDRQIFVGLVTPVGAFLAGRQYTPAFETSAAYDIMETQTGLAAGQIVSFPAVLEIRKSDSVAYRIVKDGFSGSFMYAAGEVTGDDNKGRMLGINANYASGNFSVGIGYNTANNELGATSLTSGVIGASMKFGSDKVSVMAINIKDDNPNGLSAISGLLTPQLGAATAGLVQSKFVEAFKQDGNLYHVGYRHVTGPHTISVAYSTYKDNRPSASNVTSYGAAYSYGLSKRTDLYGVAVQYDNQGLAQVMPGGNGFLGGIAATAGTDPTSVAFGIRHRF